MEPLLTSLPHTDISLPVWIFEYEIVLSIGLLLLLVIFLTYQKWKQLESEQDMQPAPVVLPQLSHRVWLRGKILQLSPESPKFGDDIAELLREYLATSQNIQLSPTYTTEQLQSELPTVLGEIFIRVRNIRYAPKGQHTLACTSVQSHIIELLDTHAI